MPFRMMAECEDTFGVSTQTEEFLDYQALA